MNHLRLRNYIHNLYLNYLLVQKTLHPLRFTLLRSSPCPGDSAVGSTDLRSPAEGGRLCQKPKSATLAKAKGKCNGYTRHSRLHSPPGRGRSEVFRGLAECQAVPSEGSTVLCATEARKGPVGGGGATLETLDNIYIIAKKNDNSVLDEGKCVFLRCG